MKKTAVTGIGGAFVDVYVYVPANYPAKIGVEKGQITLIPSGKLPEVLSDLDQFKIDRASGGAAANTCDTLANLGIEASFVTNAGEDFLGKYFTSDFCSLSNCKLVPFPETQNETGCCICLVEPDGERTFLVSSGSIVDVRLTPLIKSLITTNSLVFLEAQLLNYSPNSEKLFYELVKLCREVNAEVAISLGDSQICTTHRDILSQYLPLINLVVGNESEIMALSNCKSSETGAGKLAKLSNNVAVTCGIRGAFLVSGRDIFKSPGYPCENPINTTGAGDTFAAGLIFGMLNNWKVSDSLDFGCYLGSKIVATPTARLASESVNCLSDYVNILNPQVTNN